LATSVLSWKPLQNLNISPGDILLSQESIFKVPLHSFIMKKGTLKFTLILISISTTLLLLVNKGSLPALSPTLHPLPIAGHQRLLILAPHCDDETLSSAGLILAAERAGMEVRVVIETNGDGYLFATMEDFHRLYPHAADFIRMGKLRQQESLAALRLLGLPAEKVYFFSYPDRGTPDLWNYYWQKDAPYRSPYSADTKSPYPITYDPNATYSGQDLLADLLSILESYRPDLVIYPHPDDVHPDHWGLSVFTRLALTTMEHDHPEYHLDAFTYLVHRPDFPTPKKLRPQYGLYPPREIIPLDQTWYRLDLNPEDEKLKEQAIHEYRSQLPLLANLLESFVRQNELFAQIKPATISMYSSGNVNDPTTWVNPEGAPISPVQRDPVRDTLSRDMLGAADLVALYASQKTDGSIILCAQVRSSTNPLLRYTLRVTGITSNNVIHLVKQNREKKDDYIAVVMNKNDICATLSANELKKSWTIFVGADVEQIGVGILDQTAWQEVKVTPDHP
jgi:N-acetyl-1-D-myo-inositol-2-amino-2-deoxy-alpha-D-glucopyranoside deacetylase